jgi:hypothetical protein
MPRETLAKHAEAGAVSKSENTGCTTAPQAEPQPCNQEVDAARL